MIKDDDKNVICNLEGNNQTSAKRGITVALIILPYLFLTYFLVDKFQMISLVFFYLLIIIIPFLLLMIFFSLQKKEIFIEQNGIKYYRGGKEKHFWDYKKIDALILRPSDKKKLDITTYGSKIPDKIRIIIDVEQKDVSGIFNICRNNLNEDVTIEIEITKPQKKVDTVFGIFFFIFTILFLLIAPIILLFTEDKNVFGNQLPFLVFAGLISLIITVERLFK